MKKIVLIFALVFITMISPYRYGKASYDTGLKVSYQVDENYPPYTYTNKEYLYGFDFDLTNLIFNSPEYNLEYSVDSWNKIYKRLVREEIDLAGIMAIYGDRKKEVLFTEPLFKTYVAIYTKGNFKEIKLEDLEKLKIGVGSGYYTESILRDKLDISQYTTYENIIEAVKDLEAGRIDIIFENQQLMDNILIAEGLKGSIIPQMTDLFPVEFAYGISKSRPDLVQYMNDRIRQLKKEGVFEELYIKYFYRHSEEYIQKGYIKITLGVTLGILCICIIILAMRHYIIHLKKKLETNYIHLQTANQELTLVHEELQAQYEEIQKQYKEIEIKQTELEMMAYYDNLTNLPNRVFANEKLGQVLKDIKETGGKAAAYYIEIDNFKHINDTLGHDFGDLLIKCVGEKLSHIIDEHCFTARVGGDEYIILAHGLASKEHVIKLAEDIMSLFCKNWEIEDHETFISASIGITVMPDDGTELQKIFQNTDIAMYAAKAAGKGNYKLFDEKMLQQVQMRNDMEKSMRKAIENHEFRLYYQPYFNAVDGELVGMEALIRWTHPKKGMISPTQFIPIAEETGLISTIGRWVIEEACKQNKEWQDKGFKKLAIAVNVSGLQLETNEFEKDLVKILEDTKIMPQYVQIEITESSIMKSIDANIKILNKLKRLGIKISLDDFGTGYSSLAYMQKLPVNTIKIDKSFVDEIKKRNEASLIIGDIISISHKLNMEVIAEGVETNDQLTYLKEKGCDKIQGFLLSKPLPNDEMERLLQKVNRSI